MPLSCNWPTKVITIPLSELTLVSGTYYTLDVTYYFQLLRELNGSAEGISQTIGAPLYFNTSPTTGTPRIVDVINGFTIQFENLQISVDFKNGNTNWRVVEIRNDVSIGTDNVAAAVTPDLSELSTELWNTLLEGGFSAAEILRIIAAAAAGEASGLDTLNPIYMAIDNSKPRIAAIVDQYGNRISTTLDGA